MGFLVKKFGPDAGQKAEPEKSSRRRERERETVVLRPSDENEYWISRTPGILAQIRRERR